MPRLPAVRDLLMSSGYGVSRPTKYNLFTSFLILLFSMILIITTAARGASQIASAGCVPAVDDARVLLAFKNGVIDPLEKLSSWEIQNNVSCENAKSSSSLNSSCQQNWTGVVCQNQQRVGGLQLFNLSLEGTASAAGSLCQLPFLGSLNLSFNALVGTVPSELGNCTSLSSLDLSQNKITGGVPSELGKLQLLQELYLYGNGMNGTIPAALGNCSALQELVLAENSLVGQIPPHLGELKSLRVLQLFVNSLTGSIPMALANNSALQILALGNNQLVGRIPDQLGRLQRLDTLVLSVNTLSGVVPLRSLANCTALETLDLSSNNFAGSIPSELGNLKKLLLLYLWGNQHLTGSIPSALGNCSALQQLEVSENELNGSIPDELGRLQNLGTLNLRNNRLTGVLPITLANCTNLTKLSVNHNVLTGDISSFLPAFYNLTDLQVLHLGDNSFRGTVPDGFNHWSNLVNLDLSRNNFKGNLPQWLGGQLIQVLLEGNMFEGSIPLNLSTSVSLQNLDLSFNNLSGTIPDSFGALSGLVSLDLSHNRLSGAIPPQIGSLAQLISLNLSDNALSGNIPSTLSSCAELQKLNFSSNKLTGNLPGNFGNLRSLILLDLSFNQFNGNVPDTAPFNVPSITNLAGNPGLCGLIVDRECNNSSNTASTTNFRRRRKIIICVLVGFGLAGIIIFILAFWVSRTRNPPGIRVRCDVLIARHRELIAMSGTELTNSCTEENLLGAASVGTVYQVFLSGGQAVVAVKVLKQAVALQAEKQFLKEITILSKVRHRNIVKVLGYYCSLDTKAIILEFMPNGNLENFIHGENRLAELSTQGKLHILAGVADGLAYLHHHHPEGSIVHCDLKPGNILLDADLEPRISDFGIARLFSSKNFEQSTSLLLRGSIGYIAPEYGSNRRATTQGDVYSFGVIMLELLTGKRPTCDDFVNKGHTLVSWVQSAYPERVLSVFDCPQMSEKEAGQLAGLALMCTQHLPANRPSMLEISSFFQGST